MSYLFWLENVPYTDVISFCPTNRVTHFLTCPILRTEPRVDPVLNYSHGLKSNECPTDDQLHASWLHSPCKSNAITRPTVAVIVCIEKQIVHRSRERPAMHMIIHAWAIEHIEGRIRSFCLAAARSRKLLFHEIRIQNTTLRSCHRTASSLATTSILPFGQRFVLLAHLSSSFD